MSRFALITPDQATGEAKELLTSARKQLGSVPNFMAALANAPAALSGFLALHSSLGRGALDPKIRERLALMLAEANSCQYCVSAHSAIGSRAGLSEQEIRAARQTDSAEQRADAALKFARAVLDNRGELTSSEFSAVREAGFGDEEILEIIAHVALNVWTNFLAKAGQIEIDFPEVPLLGAQPTAQPSCAC